MELQNLIFGVPRSIFIGFIWIFMLFSSFQLSIENIRKAKKFFFLFNVEKLMRCFFLWMILLLVSYFSEHISLLHRPRISVNPCKVKSNIDPFPLPWRRWTSSWPISLCPKLRASWLLKYFLFFFWPDFGCEFECSLNFIPLLTLLGWTWKFDKECQLMIQAISTKYMYNRLRYFW